jgi:hypothetical protein
MKKTNKKWYPSEQDGNYYKLVNDVLVSSPMNEDGSRDKEEVEVEFENLEYETGVYEIAGKKMTVVEYLRTIEEELKSKK